MYRSLDIEQNPLCRVSFQAPLQTKIQRRVQKGAPHALNVVFAIFKFLFQQRIYAKCGQAVAPRRCGKPHRQSLQRGLRQFRRQK